MTEKTDWGAVARENLRRLRERDRPDQKGVALPQPGERHNASAIPVNDTALAALLALAQQGMALAACPIEDCENCNAHRLIWWDCCNALDRSTAISLQAWLNAEGYGLPEAPWEDVTPEDLEGEIGYRMWEE